MKTYDERTAAVLDKVQHKKKTHRAIVAAVTSSAACIFVLVMSLVLFLPTNTQTATGPYSTVIIAVNRSGYRNNWEAWTSDVSIGTVKEADGLTYAPNEDNAQSAPRKGAATATNEAATGEHYVENTNLQVADVKEGDLLKESDHYFYRLARVYDSQSARNDLRLDVFGKAGKDTRCDVSYRFAPFAQEATYLFSYEMYLAEDCRTITVVADGCPRGDYFDWITCITTLDISDLAHVSVKDRRTVTGEYLTSRMTGGRLLVATYYRADDYDTAKPDTFVPYVAAGEEKALIAPDQIVCPTVADGFYYTVLTLFDADLSLKGQSAVLGGRADALYANDSRAYVANVNYDVEDATGDVTQIACVDYTDRLHLAGTIEVEGRVTDQYWMDEYDGVLRVASTVNDYGRNRNTRRYTVGNNANLTCYDVKTLQQVACVSRFAPEGESVQSARFVGTKAYVCTAEVVLFTDPVYCFDLSDYSHVTYVETGAIDGYSTSLVPFKDGTLLGIGENNYYSFKLELYRETDTAVDSVAGVVLGSMTETESLYTCDAYDLFAEYKSYLLDVEDGVVGVACANNYTAYDYDAMEYTSLNSKYYYVLFTYRQGVLQVARKVEFEGIDGNARAAVADGYVYIFSQDELKVLSLEEL